MVLYTLKERVLFIGFGRGYRGLLGYVHGYSRVLCATSSGSSGRSLQTSHGHGCVCYSNFREPLKP